MPSLINSSGCMTHGDKTKPLINASLQPAQHDIPCRWKRECLYRQSEALTLERLDETDWKGGGKVHYSPSLITHAPWLSNAALLPHFDHACEGLHTRLPLGDQRHLSLHAHIGPGRKTVIKNTEGVKSVESRLYICADDYETIFEGSNKWCR